ncbi:MAG: site-specific integrase [bacterium]
MKTQDKKIAAVYVDEVKARLREQALSGVTPIRTADLIDEWLMFKEKSVRSSSYCRYRAVTDKAAPFLPEQAHMTTAANIERYKIWLMKEKYHPTSIIYELQVLRDLFRFATRLEYVRSNPAESVEYPKKPISEITHYTTDELEVIFAECERRTLEGREKQRLEAWEAYAEVFHCLNYTGMRISDVLALQWDSVNLAFGTITLNQEKTGRTVYIRIPTAYKERLIRLAETHGATGYVYTNMAGNPILYAHIDRAVRKVLKSCGMIKKSPIHSFRHTTAQRLLSAGVSVDAVAGQLGDTVETVVRTYVRPTTASQDAIDKAYGAAPEGGGNAFESQVSQKCHKNIEEIAVFKGNKDNSDKRPILQKAQ